MPGRYRANPKKATKIVSDALRSRGRASFGLEDFRERVFNLLGIATDEELYDYVRRT